LGLFWKVIQIRGIIFGTPDSKSVVGELNIEWFCGRLLVLIAPDMDIILLTSNSLVLSTFEPQADNSNVSKRKCNEREKVLLGCLSTVKKL
jgi:hypothetical protein